MKKQIRLGIFESNSSSSHVICITKNDHILTTDEIVTSYKDYDENSDKELFYINDKGEWHIWGDIYFGRGFKIMSSLEDKALYAIAEYCGDYSSLADDEKDKKLDEIHEILFSVVPQMIDIDLPTEFIDVFIDLDGNELDPEDVLINWDVNRESAMRHFYKKDGKIHPAKYADYGYEKPKIDGIDHQSQGLLTQFLITEGITLKEFLLNKRYVIIEDSDETCLWSEMKQSGLIDKNNIVKEYTAWQAYKDSKKLDPEYAEWLAEQEQEENDNEETD